MRGTIVLALTVAMPLAASAQPFAHEPGTGMSGPASSNASNIDGMTTRSPIAPHLPQPGGGEDAGPWRYLHDAERALHERQTGKAQQALEMAETRLLDRSTPVAEASQPDARPLISLVGQARQALGHNDMAGADRAVREALMQEGQGMDRSGSPMSGAMSGPMGGPGGMGAQSPPMGPPPGQYMPPPR